MLPESKVTAVTERYLAELLPALTDDAKRSPPWTVFLDSACASGRYADLLTASMLPWHLHTSNINHRLRRSIGQPLIQRINPVVKRQYRPQELVLLKYNLHFQLALGLEVVVVLVDSPTTLEAYFGVDNLAIVAHRKLITDHQPYDPAVPSELQVRPWTDSAVRDLYTATKEIDRRFSRLSLHYTSNAFTCSRRELKPKYGELLYALQSGRCAISGDPLIGSWHVDHIVPIENGGNNTLINLQAANHRENILKSSKMVEPRFCFSATELSAAGLGATYHRRLSDRRLVGVPIGPDAPFYLAAWMN